MGVYLCEEVAAEVHREKRVKGCDTADTQNIPLWRKRISRGVNNVRCLECSTLKREHPRRRF